MESITATPETDVSADPSPFSVPNREISSNARRGSSEDLPSRGVQRLTPALTRRLS